MYIAKSTNNLFFNETTIANKFLTSIIKTEQVYFYLVLLLIHSTKSF